MIILVVMPTLSSLVNSQSGLQYARIDFEIKCAESRKETRIRIYALNYEPCTRVARPLPHSHVRVILPATCLRLPPPEPLLYILLSILALSHTI